MFKMIDEHFRAVLFDLDGTLLNTLPDIASALNRALTAEGLPPRPLADYGRIVGSGIREAIRRAAPEGTDSETLERIHTRYQGDYPERCTVETVCYPGVAPLLAYLRDAGVALAVITNKTEATSRRIVAHYFPEIPFRFVWGGGGQRPLKPAAEAGALACRRLELRPAQIAFVGDSDVDMLFAHNAGFFAVGAAWGYRGAAELSAAGADWLCSGAAELADEFRRILQR